jgi:hypothetical protein
MEARRGLASRTSGQARVWNIIALYIYIATCVCHAMLLSRYIFSNADLLVM